MIVLAGFSSASEHAVGSPVTPHAVQVVGDERTRRAGLRCADVGLGGVDQRCAPKKAGT